MFGIHLERCHGNILSFVLMWLKKLCFIVNCGIRHVTIPIATRILIANVRHIGLSNICVINLVYMWNRYKAAEL